MSLVEKWRQESAEWQSMNPLVAGAYAGCARDMESACTPRAPKAEWFGAPFDADGKPTGKWDAWWVSLGDSSSAIWYECHIVPDPDPEFGMDNPMVTAWNRFAWRKVFDDLSAVTECVPVAREGYPSPVGWSVVGG